MIRQISMFDGTKKFTIDKPVRLISLFSGYDSQNLALNYLGIDHELYRTCEWAIKSIQALKDLHFDSDQKDYSAELTREQVAQFLIDKGISMNYNEPMQAEQIKRMKEPMQRQIYNNIMASHNLVNIEKTRGGNWEFATATNIFTS